MNASAVVWTVSWILSITSLLTKTNKKVFSYSSCLFIFLALLWIPTIFSKPQPVTSAFISWTIHESGLLQSLLEIAKGSLILKSQNMKSLWKVFCVMSEGKKQDNWNTAWLLFSLREKRLPLSSSCQTAWGFRRTEALLGDGRVTRDRRDLPALLCMSLKGKAAHLPMWMCRAEGETIHTIRRTAGHRFRQTEQASNFGSAALSAITCHYCHFFREKKLICSSVDLCAKELIPEYSSGSGSIWVIRISKVLATLIRNCYKVCWIPTKISRCSLCTHQRHFSFQQPCLWPCFKITLLVSWLVFWKSFLLLSTDIRRRECDI